MKITNKSLLSLNAGITQLQKQRVGAALTFKFVRIMFFLVPLLEAIEEQRKNLVKTLGTQEKDAEGNLIDNYTFTPEAQEKFNAEVKELLAVENDLALPTVTEKELSKLDAITPEIVFQLIPVIADFHPEDKPADKKTGPKKA